MSEHMFHTVRRDEIEDGARVRLVLLGYDYTRDGKATAPEILASVIVEPQFVEWKGQMVQVHETIPAAELVRDHLGPRYTVVDLGRGWKVESTAPIGQFYG
jgi:hypothetical protein